MQVIVPAIFFITIFSMSAAYATSNAVLHLDHTGDSIRENSLLTFSGQLTTSNGTAIPHRTIFIKDDTSYIRPDTTLGITITDDNGKFSTSWKAVPKDNGNPYHCYALFVGGKTYGFTRSEVYELSIVIQPETNHDQKTSKLPDWFKDSSKLWHEGQIKDSDFAYGINSLMDYQIIKKPQNENIRNMTIPSWVKNNAGWFAEGQISENDFLNALQYLIDNNIMIV